MKMLGVDMNAVDMAAFGSFIRQRDEDLQDIGKHGLRGPGTPAGWQCPNCGKAHAPDVSTCPEPARGGSLRDRLKR